MQVGCASCRSRWMFVRGLTYVCALLSLRICAAEERCPPLTKKLLAPHARMNTIMITAVDRVLYKRWIPSNWASAAKAGITYNFIAALDNQTSLGLKEELGIERCFTPDLSRLNYHLDAKHPVDGAHVDWGGQHWHETTWTKVLVVRMVFDMGFHVIHADSDITWFANPMQFFGKHIATGPAPPHMIVSLDCMGTLNKAGEDDLERDIHPYASINTGVYLLKHWPHSTAFFDEWLRWYSPAVLNDQHALNHLIRGQALTGEKAHPSPVWDKDKRIVWAAFNATAAIAYLPASQFANSYTFIKGRLYQRMNQTLYLVHWTWSGAAYNKQQNMRDAGVYLDTLEYYSQAPLPLPASAGPAGESNQTVAGPQPLMLLSMDLVRPEAPPEFNDNPPPEKYHMEEMVHFHVAAVNAQLQQLYYGFLAALALNRTLVMPRANCFCSRNWYRMHNCRINDDRDTQFPYTCTMHDILRTRYVIKGIRLPTPWGTTGVVHVREYSFLENPRTPAEIKSSRLVVQAAAPGSLGSLEPRQDGNGSAVIEVPLGLAIEDWADLVGPVAARYRTLHLTDAPRMLSTGFKNTTAHLLLDYKLRHHATFWCCRDPDHMMKFNVTDREVFQMLPPSRHGLLQY
ncbi:nucleotide-diphospho-sugar transferase-domain-containing protein [Haematococcus lacustris]